MNAGDDHPRTSGGEFVMDLQQCLSLLILNLAVREQQDKVNGLARLCLLYDSHGKLLDTIQLDLLIEEYVRRVTETTDKEEKPSVRTILRITDKDDEFLGMLQQRDMDVEYAVTLLHVSRQKLETMIQKLLQLEMLQYISDNEVKLTEKGLQHLLEKKEDSAQRSLNGPLQ